MSGRPRWLIYAALCATLLSAIVAGNMVRPAFAASTGTQSTSRSEMPNGPGAPVANDPNGAPAKPDCVVMGLQLGVPPSAACPRAAYDPVTHSFSKAPDVVTWSVSPSPALIHYDELFTVNVPAQVVTQLPQCAFPITGTVPNQAVASYAGCPDALNPSNTVCNYPTSQAGCILWTPTAVTVYFELTSLTDSGLAPAPSTCATSFTASDTCETLALGAGGTFNFHHTYNKVNTYYPLAAVQWKALMPFSLSVPLENPVQYQTLNCYQDPAATPNFWPNTDINGNNWGGSTAAPGNNDPQVHPDYCTSASYLTATQQFWTPQWAVNTTVPFTQHIRNDQYIYYYPNSTPWTYMGDSSTSQNRNFYQFCEQCSSSADLDAGCYYGWTTALYEPGSGWASEHSGGYDRKGGLNPGANPGGDALGCLQSWSNNPDWANPSYWSFNDGVGDHDDWSSFGSSGIITHYNEMNFDYTQPAWTSRTNRYAKIPPPWWANWVDNQSISNVPDSYNSETQGSCGGAVPAAAAGQCPNPDPTIQYNLGWSSYNYAGVTNQVYLPNPVNLETSGYLACPDPTNLSDPVDWVGGVVGGTLKPECKVNTDTRTWYQFFNSYNVYTSQTPTLCGASVPGWSCTSNVITPTAEDNQTLQWNALPWQTAGITNQQSPIGGYNWIWWNSEPNNSNCNKGYYSADADGDAGNHDNFNGYYNFFTGADGQTASENAYMNGGDWGDFGWYLVDWYTHWGWDSFPNPCAGFDSWNEVDYGTRWYYNTYDGWTAAQPASTQATIINNWTTAILDTPTTIQYWTCGNAGTPTAPGCTAFQPINGDYSSAPGSPNPPVVQMPWCSAQSPSGSMVPQTGTGYCMLRKQPVMAAPAVEYWTDGYDLTLQVMQEQPVQGANP